MTKTQFKLMTRYLKTMDGRWRLEEHPLECDVCDWSTTKRDLRDWIELGERPYLCSNHARELSLLW